MFTLLLVEDDAALRAALVHALSGRYALRLAATAAEALRILATAPVDLVVLDLGLPDLDGGVAIRMIRGFTAVPVIVATARREEASIIQLLNAGADDYLVKPFSAGQLTARVNALLRRALPQHHDRTIQVGELSIDLGTRTVDFAGDGLELTRREFDLLSYLAQHAGKVVSRKRLLENVWSNSERGNDQTLDVHISWLRRKLGESAARPRYLHTVRGVGIKLVAPT
jgi:two-component system KDP operon response regulator KdpE